jgi:lipoprotein signal peptidase
MPRASAWLLAAVFVLVIGTDQAVKWWAWRHVDGALINTGGYVLLGQAIRSWFAGVVTGAVANGLGAVAVCTALHQLLRRHRATHVVIGVGVIAAGVASNLLDRAGVHNLTAPGSEHGVVDLIPSGGSSRCNVADLWIVLGAVLLCAGLVRRAIRAGR